MRHFGILLALLLLQSAELPAQRLKSLEIFGEEYPRAGYFRIAEATIRTQYSGQEDKYKEWSSRLSDLSGIMGKTEFEELARNNPHEQIYRWFKRFKADYPEKFVIVHMNGRGRIPNYRLSKFSPGHWLYFEGSDVKTALPGGNNANYQKEVWIEVEDPSHFRLDNGARFKTPDDITLVRKNSDGTLDWDNAEYVRLMEISGNRIKVRRGMFQSKPIRFEAGKTYAAPHLMGGPWESTANMVWYYNLSTECPRDKNGKNCADILLEELTANFAKGGRWETFDGVQFDVMMSVPTTGYHERRKALGQRADVNMDGVQDNGVVGGVQTYGAGCFDFLTRLRAAVGNDRIIAADGREEGCQTAGNGVLSGVEMEGIPEQVPYGYATWSTTCNMLNLWKPLTASPHFNYGAFRYNHPDKLAQEELFQYYRLAFAQSVFTDSFLLCNSWTTLRGIPDLRELFGLSKDEKPVGWLGKPLEPARHLAASFPDAMEGTGNPVTERACSPAKTRPYIHAAPKDTYATAAVNADGILVITPTKEREVFGFVLRNVPYVSDQVYVEVTMRSADAPSLYPEGYNRALVVSANNQRKRFMEQRSVVSDRWETHRFYFGNTFDYMTRQNIVYNPDGETKFDLRLMIRDADRPVEISKITVHSAPEIVTRKFEYGAVIANLSNEPYHSEEFGIAVPGKDAVFIRTNNK